MSTLEDKQSNSFSDYARNLIEDLDTNYTQEFSKLPQLNIASLNPVDHVVMRKWLAEEYMTLPRTPPTEARSRSTANIHTETILTSYSDGNQFSVRVYNPTADDGGLRPALIMYHGGGWIHGFPEVDEGVSEFFASELRSVVISVDYRLAPEYQFPSDCYEAIQWTIDNAGKYKINTSRIGLWGCSAGGNLATGVALRDAAEHKVSRVRHVNLVVPVTCHPDLYPTVLQRPRCPAHVSKALKQKQHVLRALWEKYTGTQFSHLYASVLLAPAPLNHPPTYITVAGVDEIRDEGIAYAMHLRNAGIDTQLEIIQGVPHSINVPVTTHAARQFYRNQARVLKYAFYIEKPNPR